MSVLQSFPLSRELLGEALLLRPLVVVSRRVLLQDLGVLGDEVLAAESADGHDLRGLDRGAVLVDLDAGASGVGLLVLAGDAVLLGDRHFEWVGFVGRLLGIFFLVGGCVWCWSKKAGILERGKNEDPFFHEEN